MKTITKYIIVIAALLGFNVNGWAQIALTDGTVTVEGNHKTYTGSEITPSSTDITTVRFDGNLIDPSHITIGADGTKKGTNVGTYNAAYTITGDAANYTGTVYFPLIIDPAELSDEIRFTVTEVSETWTESLITPTFVIKDGSTSLTQGTDYTITGQTGAINPGTYTITFTGNGNYTGTRTFNWTISKGLALENVTIAPATYNGTAQIPTVIVKDGTKVLSQGVDYTLTLSDASGYTNAGSYTGAVTVTGIGAYKDQVVKNFVISPKDINLCTVTGNSVEYTGNNITPTITVKDGATTLTVTTDYTATLPTQKEVGTYSEAITITGANNYTGTKKVDFIIAPGGAANIATAVVTSAVTYTGSAQAPSATNLTVKIGTTTLTEGTDFTLSYNGVEADYVNAKTYANAIVLTGKGSYYGSLTADYTIQPRDINETTVTGNSVNYTGSVIDPTITVSYGGNDLTSGTDYDITKSDGYTYKDPQVYADAITLTGKGNFTGTKVLDYTITNTAGAKDLATAVVLSTAVFNGKNQAPLKGENVVVKIGDAVIPVADYNITYNGAETDYFNAKTYANAIVITASGNGNCFGSLTADYVIVPYDINDNKVTTGAGDMVWTGSTLTKTQKTNDVALGDGYHIYFSNGTVNSDLVPSTDYTMQTVASTIKDEGEYSLIFVGIGNYTGSKTIKFNVLKDMAAEENVTGIHFDIPAQIKNGTFDFSVVATDTKSHTTLHEGTDFTMAFKTSTDGDIAENAIADQGKYKVIFSGVAPKYNGTRTVEFFVVNPYQLVAAGEYAAVSLHITEPGYPVDANSPTGAVVIGEMQVGDNGTAAVDATAKRVLIPANNTVSIGTTNIVFNIVGIENGAFDGCTELRFIDARLIANYTPSSLSRTATNTPFKGVPKQTLVYLTGTTVEGENYIYDTGAGLNCETFKIYDDYNGNQKGFADATDAKWDMEIPVAFTANNIVNTRKLTAVANNKQQGYTVCLPYALPIPESFKAYTLSYSKGATTIGTVNYDGILGFTEVAAPETTELTAMTPYVLIPSASGQCLSTTNATVKKTYTVGTGYDDITAKTSKASGSEIKYDLKGTMQYLPYAAGMYIMQANNIWGSKTTASDYPGPCVLPMRAYIQATASPARLFSVFENADGSTTVIKGLQIDADAAGEIYDLQGRKVSAPQRNGLYIVNGKKVVMK